MLPVGDCTSPPEAGKPNCGHATAPRPCYLGVGGITFVSQNPTAEHRRLSDSANRRADWKNWGPYLAERAWGTVREDYSASGDAWNHFPHDHARSRAYRWNEDGLAGYCNRFPNLCLSATDDRSTQACWRLRGVRQRFKLT